MALSKEELKASNEELKALLQGYLDTAAEGLFAQGRPSRDAKTGNCLYRFRDEGGLCKCGVGQLIPDDEYDPMMDVVDDNKGTGVETVNRKFDLFPSAAIHFLSALQDAHDTAARYGDRFCWKLNILLAYVAKDHDLTYQDRFPQPADAEA